MSDTNWVPGLVVAGIAVLAGNALAIRARGASPLRPSAERRVDLLARKLALYESIRAMADTAQSEERARLELEAAQVLYDLDHIAPDLAPAAPVPRKPGFATRHPQLVGALWGAGIVGFAGALYVLLQDYTKPRTEMGSVTGNAQSEGPNAAVGSDDAAEGDEAGRPASAAELAELAKLEAAAKAAPADVVAQNAYAHALIGLGNVMDAFHISEKVVAIDPTNAEARTHQAVVLLDIGDTTTAAKVLDRVLEHDPAFPEALGYRGALYYEAKDTENAIKTWEKARDADPAYAAEFSRLIAMAQKGPPTDAPEGTSGGPGIMGGGAVEADTTPEFTGTITLAAGATVPAGAMLFVYARAPGVDAGPPLRVVRVAAPSFPYTFSISAANAPMGGTLTGPVVLTARLDGDGNPMTKDAADLTGKSGEVQTGATDIAITVAAP